MDCVEVAAYAKINLALDVLGKREDGYHDLMMIMQTVSLHDTIWLEAAEEGISLECKSKWVPQDRTNIAWKAAELLMGYRDIKSGVRIRINKRIPVAAGLAGGSADAAAVLKGMNILFKLGLDQDELKMLGVRIGADVPFCLSGGTRLAEGIGERLTVLDDFSGIDIVLVRPRVGVSTAWVFGNLELSEIKQNERPDIELIVQAIAKRDKGAVARNMKNVLETVTVPRYGIIQEAKDKLIELGALGSMMSGSGPVVFGIFPDSITAAAAYGKLATDRRWQCFCTKSIKDR